MTQDNSSASGLSAAQRARLLQHLRQKNQAKAQQHALPRADLTAPVPVSFAQQRLWLLHQLAPNDLAYHWPACVRCIGALEPSRLQHSLALLLARHASLRTSFSVIDGQPMQMIGPAPTADAIPLPVISLEHLSPDAQEAEVQRVIDAAVRQPFDLQHGPLLHARLLRLHPTEHVLVLFLHHIISDGWSASILLRDTLTLYQALAAGHNDDAARAALPDLPIQYADYAIWQRRQLQGETRDRLLRYWHDQLQPPLPRLELPTDYPRPAHRRSEGVTTHVRFPATNIAALRQLGAAHDATLFMGLLAVWGALLSRTSGQRDLLIGTPIAGRTRPEVAELIGFFTNTLVLRLDLSGNPTFRELLQRVRQVCLDAYAHQEMPFEQLVETLPIERHGTDNPLFQVFYMLDNTPEPEFAIPGLRLDPVGFDSTAALFDLSLSVRETADEVTGSLSCRTDLFAPATIERLAGHLRVLLAAVLNAPDLPLARLPLLSAAERRQILLDWNATARPYAQDRCLHDLVAEQASRAPDACAVVCEDQSLTYAELDARANQLAHQLQALGVQAESRVAVCLERSLELIVGLLGILKAGACYVPLDPSYPVERLRFMLADAQAPVLLTTAALAAHVAPSASDQPNPLHVLTLDRDAPTIANQPTTAPTSTVAVDNLAYIIYTSGSTGTPKGTMNGHRGIVNRLLWMQQTFELGPHERMLHKTPYSFDVSVWELFAPLISGATLVVARPGGHHDPAYLADLIARERITLAHFVPSLLRLFLDEPNLDRLTTLRRVICSGEALTPDLQQRFFARVDAELHNLYGPTEAAIEVSAWQCQPGASSVPIGYPIANTQLYVLDAQLNPQPIGVAGELHIGGVQVGRGYQQRPDLTAERFIPDPFSRPEGTRPGGRLYRTGDRARLRDDGAIEYLGRLDHQIKLRGNRVELGEIEAALTAHPAVHEAVVLVREDRPGDQRLVAYVVGEQKNKEQRNKEQIRTADSPSPIAADAEAGGGLGQGEAGGEGLTPAELRAFLKQRLPEYMLPGTWVFLDALPLTPSGKLDRAALPAIDTRTHEHEYVAPETALEVQLVRIWEAALQVQPVGVTDNFFERGGHSLLAVRLLAQIEKQLGQTLPLAMIFDRPTIRELATALYEMGWPGVLRIVDHLPQIKSPVVAIQPAGTRPPFFLTAPLGGVLPSNILAGLLELMPHFGAEQPYYGLQVPGVAQELWTYLDPKDLFNLAQIQIIAQQFTPDPAIIAASAARCITAMREVDPNGPYLIGGFCTGSVLAFEIACQLQRQGKSVALLALIDPPPPMAAEPQTEPAESGQPAAILDMFERPDPAQAAWFITRDLANERLTEHSEAMDLEAMIAAFQRLDPEEWWAYGAAALQQAIKSDVDPQELRRLFMIAQINMLSLNYTLSSYVARRYPGRITIIQSEQLSGDAATRLIEWQQFSTEQIAQHRVPGDHSTLFLQPNIQVLTQTLRNCMAEAVASVEE